MFTDPIKNLKQLRLTENMIVADLGAGTGFYSIPAAQMVPNGKVYAIEIQKDFLGTVRNKAKEVNLNNLECFLGDIEQIGGTQIKDNIIDAIIISNVFFQVENKDKFIKEVKRILKSKGRVLIIDWSEESLISPNSKIIVSKNKTREMFQKEGFIFERDINTGAYHYGMILIKE